jgi:hypothetical protein
MKFHQSGALRFLTFDSLEEVPHAVLTRQGGISQAPWKSLNLGATVGDVPEHVNENRLRAFRVIGSDPGDGFDVWQVHGNRVVCAERPRLAGEPYQQADAILTNVPGVALFMRFADCVPILLWEPFNRVVGIVHAGWQGTIKQVVVQAVLMMQAYYGCDPANIRSAMGPSIAAHHYRVGADVIQQVHDVFGEASTRLLNAIYSDHSNSAEFDLWKANSLLLESCGVRNIEVAGVCTACHLDDWYSHRGEAGKTGRFGVLIKLPSDEYTGAA